MTTLTTSAQIAENVAADSWAAYTAVAKLLAPSVMGAHFERREALHELVGDVWTLALVLTAGELLAARQAFAVGTAVRVTCPLAPDYGQVGTVGAIHHGESYVVGFAGYARSYGAGELAAEPVNALGEPMPATPAEAAARQLLGEIVEGDALWRSATPEARESLTRARTRKVRQLEKLGFVLTQNAARELCVVPAALAGRTWRPEARRWVA